MKVVARICALLIVWLLFRRRQKPTLLIATDSNSLLWQVTGNGLVKPSYIFGTMHLMCAEDAVVSPSLKAVLKKVQQVYFEVDMDHAGTLLGGVVDFNMKQDSQLKDFLTEDEYEQVRMFFKEHQPMLPFEMLERQHPLILSSGLYEFFLPCQEKNGAEVKIAELAHKLAKPTGGLESLAFQQHIFDSIPYDQQAKDLVKTINNVEHFKQSMHDMLAVYKSQDIEKLQQLTMQDESGVSTHLDMLLYNRNNNWVTSMQTIMKDTSTLFAVGAGHLAGENGVLDLLRKQGFSTQPIIN